MSIHVLQVPYDSGHRAERMGHGPLHLIQGGALLDRLRRAAAHPDVRLVPIETAAPFTKEIGSAFELHRAVASEVVVAAQAGLFCLVLSGNCNSAVGTVSGLRAAAPDEPVGVVWLDGHGDCNTPDTFAGTFLDAMGTPPSRVAAGRDSPPRCRDTGPCRTSTSSLSAGTAWTRRRGASSPVPASRT